MNKTIHEISNVYHKYKLIRKKHIRFKIYEQIYFGMNMETNTETETNRETEMDTNTETEMKTKADPQKEMYMKLNTQMGNRIKTNMK